MVATSQLGLPAYLHVIPTPCPQFCPPQIRCDIFRQHPLTMRPLFCIVSTDNIRMRARQVVDAPKTSGRKFAEHWAYAREKGLMNQSTASAVETAVRRVLATEDDWEKVDINSINVDDLINRFNNLNANNFKPRSLRDYGQRFRRALTSYKSFLDDPGNWKYASRGTTKRTTSPPGSVADEETTPRDGDLSGQTASPTPLQTYTYPFRDGVLARLDIPRDANTGEINRLIAWARTLASDYEPPE